MRLINTHTLEIHEFIDVWNAPVYAILSHCWGDDEVSFKEYTKRKNRDGAGYKKIVECCAFAKNRTQRWLWVDTACIDKRSSAELTEAINSMCEWYAQANECYAYLADVTTGPSASQQLSQQFCNSRWFKRGWTLQELIAPHHVVFLAQDWAVIGHTDRSTSQDSTNGVRQELNPFRLQADGPNLTCIVAGVTGVPIAVMQEAYTFVSDFSAAQRLSWMKYRDMTRIEDFAYCLLGIFDVTMPLLYGEGTKAFQRLQIEILNRTGDESVLITSRRTVHGLLPWHPSKFVSASSVIRLMAHDRPPITVSGRWAELQKTTQRPGVFRLCSDVNVRVVRLNCAVAYEQNLSYACIMFLWHAPCGHFLRAPRSYSRLLRDSCSPDEILCEADLRDVDAWEPEYDTTTMLIHLADFEAGKCANLNKTSTNLSFTLKDRANSMFEHHAP